MSTAPAATGQDGGVEAAFDAWLRRELSRLYGAALAEPVPEALSRLLRTAPVQACNGMHGATAA